MHWPQIKSFFKSHREFLIFTHREPDGDAIGSCAALVRLLERLGKRSYVVLEKPLDPQFEEILPSSKIFIYNTAFNPLTINLNEVGVFWIDFQDSIRLGVCQELFLHGLGSSEGKLVNRKICVIDHHTPRAGRALKYCEFIHPQASNCGVLIYQIFKKLGVTLDIASSKALYWAVASDTLQFSVQNTHPLDLEVAAECLKKGVKPAKLHLILNERFEPRTAFIAVKLFQLAKINTAGNCLTIVADKSLVISGGAAIIRFIHQIMPKIAGVKAWVVAIEEATDVWRLSARSLNDIQLGTFFQKYGGGGHSAAAGASMSGDIDHVLREFEQHCEGLLTV